MFGLGALINTAAVALGGFLGLLCGKLLNENMQKTLMVACGAATIFIGAAGTLEGMLVIENGKIKAEGSMLLVLSLVIGGFIGELIGIERLMTKLGDKLKGLVKAGGNSRFTEGFVNTSLIICTGAMAIVGSVEDGLSGDFSMLAAKSVLDFVIVVILASTHGIGVVFSAGAILIYEGAITLIAHFAGSFISEELISLLSYIGSALIFLIGINIAFDKKIRVGNLLPALIIPVIYLGIKGVV